MRYVDVAVYFPQVLGTFHYVVPEGMDLQVGHLVEVPFGRDNRPMQGVVLGFVPEPAVDYVKPVLRVVDPEAVLTPWQIALARRVAEVYLHPLAQVIPLLLPPGVARLGEVEYRMAPQAPEDPPQGPAWVQRLWETLKEAGPLRTGQLRRRFPRLDWEPVLEAWVRRGWVLRRGVLPEPRVRPGSVRAAVLALPPDHPALPPVPGRPGSAAYRRRQAVVALLREAWPEAVPVDVIYAETQATSQDLRLLEQRGLIRRLRRPTWRDPLAGMAPPAEASPPQLTPDQARAWQRMQDVLQAALVGRQEVPPVLLHGVTGSGKTELYLRAAAFALQQGRQVLLLVPEIGLAAHLVPRLVARFGKRVGLLHSGMPLGHRYDTWRRARRGEIQVLVGTRSAVFAPLPRLGLIIVDECHSEAYAEQGRGPYYHAREVARMYARIVRGAVLLGSATPEVVTLYRAQRGRMHYLRLPHRVHGPGRFPQVHLVDMREVWQQGEGGPLSPVLLEALADTLRRGEQAFLLLNRRGHATHVFCQDCGHVFRCPRCQIPLVHHRKPAGGRAGLLCHHCGYRRNWPKTCPVCGSQQVMGIGWGTERLEEEVRRRFPQARVVRWDRDTAATQTEVDLILEHLRRGTVDILIGTQVLAKGLDLPNVTFVGVVLADIGLHLPDYRAAERVFQLLTQVIGRAGRGEKPGRAVVQTYHPEHYAIRAAVAQDVRAFYREELARRRKLGYPPFNRLVRLEYRGLREDEVEAAAQDLARRLARWKAELDARATDILGPVPCFFSPLAGWHRWHIILRGPNPVRLLRGRYLPGGWRVQVGPVSLL